MAEGDPADSGRCEPADLLYRRYGSMVQRALRQLGVEPGVLDDAAQDVFLVLHRRVTDFDRRRSMPNWLWGIARGVASTYRRGQRRRHRLHEALPVRSVAPAYHTPDDHVARLRARRVLGRFLDSLDADKCAVFVMSEIEGHTGAEIAERLGVNVNTVYARLRAARQRFDVALRDQEGQARPVRLTSWWAWPFGASAKTAMATASYAAAVAAVVPTVHVSLSTANNLHVEARPRSAEATPSAVRMAKSPRASRVSSPPAKVEVDGTYDEVVLIDEDPMQRTTLAAAFVFATAAPTLAHAKPKPAEATAPADADDAALVDEDAPNRSYIYDDDVLTGEVLGPDGTLLMQRLGPKHASLINVRAHFVPELIALANDV